MGAEYGFDPNERVGEGYVLLIQHSDRVHQIFDLSSLVFDSLSDLVHIVFVLACNEEGGPHGVLVCGSGVNVPEIIVFWAVGGGGIECRGLVSPSRLTLSSGWLLLGGGGWAFGV